MSLLARSATCAVFPGVARRSRLAGAAHVITAEGLTSPRRLPRRRVRRPRVTRDLRAQAARGRRQRPLTITHLAVTRYPPVTGNRAAWGDLRTIAGGRAAPSSAPAATPPPQGLPQPRQTVQRRCAAQHHYPYGGALPTQSARLAASRDRPNQASPPPRRELAPVRRGQSHARLRPPPMPQPTAHQTASAHCAPGAAGHVRRRRDRPPRSPGNAPATDPPSAATPPPPARSARAATPAPRPARSAPARQPARPHRIPQPTSATR